MFVTKRDRLDNKNLFAEQLSMWTFGLKKLKELNFTGTQLEFYWLQSQIRWKYFSFQYLGEFEYVKNVELSSKLWVTS